MGLKDVLSKMKLIERDPSEVQEVGDPLPSGGPLTPPGDRPPQGAAGPRSPLADILSQMPPPPKIDEAKLEQVSQTATEGDEVPDFASVYRAAGVVDPPHGYTAFKVLEIFASPGFATLDLRAKAAALTGFLNMNPGGPVPITDVVQDAVKRDQALDKFEEFLRGKLASRSAAIEKENADLQKEIDELSRRNREKMEANRAALDGEQGKLTRWQGAKRTEERRLFDAVNPFVESNPITTADTPRPSPAAAAPEPAK